MKPLIEPGALASLSHKIFRAEQVRSTEPEAAAKCDCSMYELMERAGYAAFTALRRNWPMAQHVLVLCGGGNNGGDGYVLARLARQDGMRVSLVSPDPAREPGGDALLARQAWLEDGGEVAGPDDVVFEDQDVIVDGLLGTGLEGEVNGQYAALIARVNQTRLPVLSIDIPSGLAADSGEVLGDAVQADITITFVGIKPGLTTGKGKQYCGRLIFDDLHIGHAFSSLATPYASLIGYDDFAPLPRRMTGAHKGDFGKLLCIGGNRGMAGAIRLCGEAALRCGAGLVRVFCHQDSVLQVASGRPELMISCDNLRQHLMWADCVVIGPGLGQDGWSRGIFNELLSFLIHEDIPLLIDADGLNLLSHHLYKLRLSNLIITPHPAEAARLLGVETRDVESDRFTHAANLSEKFSGACVLKGAGSIVHTAERIYVCSDGNPGMATAGMGDVLSGVLGALLAQGMSADDAAMFGTCLHAAAGDLTAESGEQRGMLASDLFPLLRRLVNY